MPGNLFRWEEQIMKTHISILQKTTSVVLFATVAFAFGCGESASESGKGFGVDIPSDQPVVELASVLENPAEFDGKNIVMRGVVKGQCASLCEFFMLDGAHTATIYPQGFKFPKLERGGRVTIYALITSGEENVVISALGLRTE
jgi:hypothetical protein